MLWGLVSDYQLIFSCCDDIGCKNHVSAAIDNLLDALYDHIIRHSDDQYERSERMCKVY